MLRVAGRTWREDEVQHLREVHAAGQMTLAEIAAVFGVHPDALRRRDVKQALGLAIRRKKHNNGKLGRVPIPTGVSPLVRKLYEIINRERAGLKDISMRAGLAHNAVFGWRLRNPHIHNFEAVLNVLGKRLTIVDIKSDDQKVSQEKVKRVLPQRHYVSDFEVRE
jgi:hypothetical protein